MPREVSLKTDRPAGTASRDQVQWTYPASTVEVGKPARGFCVEAVAKGSSGNRDSRIQMLALLA